MENNPITYIVGVVLFVGLIVFGMWGCPQYKVYHQKMEGEAEFARAQQNRQIRVQEALAEMEAAKYTAERDTMRATGIKRSNEIIAQSLKANPEYLQWLFIENIEKTSSSVFYIPTEKSIPTFVLPLNHSSPP